MLQHLRIYTFSKLLPLSPAGLSRYGQGELLNRIVADVDTLDHLYLRVLSPLVGAFVVIMVVTLGLSVLDFTLAITLGGYLSLFSRWLDCPFGFNEDFWSLSTG